MAMPRIKPHMRGPIRLSIWLLCDAVCTAVVGLYAGARWAGLTAALWLAVFYPMVLMPIIKTLPRD